MTRRVKSMHTVVGTGVHRRRRVKLMSVTIGSLVVLGLIASGCGRGAQNDASSHVVQ